MEVGGRDHRRRQGFDDPRDRVAETAKTAATGIATAAQWAFNAAMDANPITLVVVALAALVAAFVLAYNKVTWFRDGVNDLWTFIKSAFDGIEKAASDVFDWLAKNWPLVLGILTGPFGLMLEQVITHWNDVSTSSPAFPGRSRRSSPMPAPGSKEAGENIVGGLLSGVKTIWTDVTTFFERRRRHHRRLLLRRRSLGSATAGNDVLAGLLSGVQHRSWTDVTTFLGGIPGDIVGVFKDAVKWLISAGKDVLQRSR